VKPRQQCLGTAGFGQHHHHALPFGGDRPQCVGGVHAEVVAPPVQQVAQRVLHLHPHQRGRGRLGRAPHQGEVQVVGDTVPVGHQPERTELGLDVALVDALHGVLGGQPIGDQVGDRSHLQPVLACEHLQLRAARHAAVGVQHFNQHAGRFQPGQHR
jgi:hypothetical protein